MKEKQLYENVEEEEEEFPSYENIEGSESYENIGPVHSVRFSLLFSDFSF